MLGRALGLALVLAGLASAPAYADEPAEAEAQKALVAFKEGRFEETVTSLQRAYDLQPKAIYIYNMGRALEQLGRLEAARQTYLRVPALAGVTDEVKALAREKADSLRAVSDKGVVRFSGLPKGTQVQVDDELVADLEADVVVTAERHIICTLTPTSTSLVCHVRRLAAGTRLLWPPAGNTMARATIVNDLGAQMAALKLDGVAMQGDWKTIRAIEVDQGSYSLTIRPKDGAQWVGNVELAGDTRLQLSSLAPAAEPSTVQATSTEEASSGPWPWVTVGTGAATVAAGIGLLVNAYLLQNPDQDSNQADAEQQWEDARPFVAAGWTLVGAGSAALIGGIVWSALDDADATVTATVAPSEQGAFLLVNGRW